MRQRACCQHYEQGTAAAHAARQPAPPVSQTAQERSSAGAAQGSGRQGRRRRQRQRTGCKPQRQTGTDNTVGSSCYRRLSGPCYCLAITSTHSTYVHTPMHTPAAMPPGTPIGFRSRYTLRLLPTQSASGRHASSGGAARGASSIGGAARGGLGQRQSRRRRCRRRYTPGSQRPRMRRSARQSYSSKRVFLLCCVGLAVAPAV